MTELGFMSDDDVWKGGGLGALMNHRLYGWMGVLGMCSNFLTLKKWISMRTSLLVFGHAHQANKFKVANL